MATRNKDQACKAKTKSGKPCRAAATAGGLCFFHANPAKAAELGRIGGRSKRHSFSEITNPLPKLESANAVRETVDRLVAEVYEGKIQPKVAAGLAPLLNLQLQAIKTTDLDLRLAKMEKQMEERNEADKSSADALKR
jgi:hypothetical protein